MFNNKQKILKKTIKNFRVGTDLVDFRFFKNINNYFIKRFLTSYEWVEYQKLLKKKPNNYESHYLFLAVKWALKEAVFKALPTKKKLFLNRFGFLKNKQNNYQCLEFSNVQVSISYYDHWVLAFAVYYVHSKP